MVEVELQVDPKYHRHFIQRRGQVSVDMFVHCHVMVM